MLYTSTRNKHDTYTAQRALCQNRADDGGLFVPVQMPQCSSQEIIKLLHLSSNDVIAKVLNVLFGTTMAGRDVEFLAGKEIFRTREINYRITVGELWRNPEGDFSRTVRILSEHLCADKGAKEPTLWAKVAVSTAMIFAMFTELPYETEADLNRKQDIVVLSEDFIIPMAAWYARKMGLPIGAIICCCNDNGNVWDLLQRGQMKLDAPLVETNTPKCDILVPSGLEWLIYETLGQEAVTDYVSACDRGGLYEISSTGHPFLRQGMYAFVVGEQRLLDIIPNVYSATGYVLCPYSALTYSGLMDYRAMTGENGSALMISQWSPLHCKDIVAKAMGISVADLRERIKQM